MLLVPVTENYPGAASANNISFVLDDKAYVGMGNDSLYKCHIDIWEFSVTGTSNINEKNTIQDVSIFPNPTSGIFTFKLPEQISDYPMVLTIYSMDGKICRQENINQSETRISLKELASGVYVYSISSQSQRHSGGKIILK